MNIFTKKYSKNQIADKFFNDKKWRRMYDLERNEIIKQIIDNAKRNISCGNNDNINMFIKEYNIDISSFIDFPIFFEWDKDYVGNGKYDNEQQTILINSDCKFENGGGRRAYYTLNHEITHAFQNYLILNQKKFLDEINDEFLKQKFLKYINLLEISTKQFENKILLFSQIKDLQLNDKITFYVNNDNAGSKDNIIITLSDMFYFLNTAEREAFYNESKIGNNLVNKYNSCTNKNIGYYDEYKNVTTQLNTFRTNYQIHKDVNIASLFDDCIYNLANNITPQSHLQASIMYDLYCIILYQNESIDKDLCCKLIQKDKEFNLQKCGFIFEEKKDLEGKLGTYIVSPEKLLNLTQNQQNDNIMHIISLASIKDKFEIISYIKDIEYFEKFCKNNIDIIFTNQSLVDGVKNLFGDDFYEKLNQNIKNDNIESENMYSSEFHNETINADNNKYQPNTYIENDDLEL